MKGLYNIGNNCYINAVVQSAIVTDGINQAILKRINESRESVQSNPIIWSYCNLVRAYLDGGNVVDNSEFVKAVWNISARWREQNDSAEFLFWFADQMKQCGVMDPLEGKDLICSQLSCGHSCNAPQVIESRGIQITNEDVSSITDKDNPIHSMIKKQQQKNEYRCSECQQSAILTQTRTPHLLPQVLSVQIVSAVNLRGCIEDVLLLDDIQGSHKYRLSALYVYHGNAHSGHYSVITVHWQGETCCLVHCDDSSIRKLRKSEDISSLMPYVRTLLYDRQPL